MACRHDVSERPAGDGGRGVSGRHAGGGAPAAAARAGSAGGAALPAFLPAPPAARFHPAAGRPPQLAAAAPGGLRLCALPRRRAGPPAPSTGVLWMMAGGRGGGGGRGRGAGRAADAGSSGAAATAAGSAAPKKGPLAAAAGDDDGFDAAEVDEDDSDDLFDPWNIDEPDGQFDDDDAEDDADAAKAFDVESLVNGDRGLAGGAGVEDDEDEDTGGGFDDMDDEEEDDDPDLDDLDDEDDEDEDEDEPVPRSHWGKRALDDDDDDDDEGMGEHDDDDVDTPIRQRKRPVSAEESVLLGSTVEEEEPLEDTVDDLDADLGLLSVAGADVLVGDDEVDDEPVVFDSEEPDIPSQRVPAGAVGGAAAAGPEEEEDEDEEEVDDLEDGALGSIDLTQLLRSRSRPTEELTAPAGGAGGDLASLFDDAHLDESTPPAVPGGGRSAVGDMVPAAAARFADVADSPEANVAARAAKKSAFEADDDYEVEGPQGLDFYTNDGEEYEGDTDEFGVTQDTSFGRVWALNDDNYVTITEPGEAFAFVDEDVVANEEDVDDAESSESLREHEATRRGAQPSWGASTASAWPAAMGGSDALDTGSKEWAARVAYERSTQASAKDMYRWSRKSAAPPPGMDDLFPDYRPAELPKLARLTLDVQDLPLDDAAGEGSAAPAAGPETTDDQSEYLSFYQELYKYEGDVDDSANVGGEAAAPAGSTVANGSVGVGAAEGIPLDAAEEEAQLEALEEATQQRLQDAVATTGKRAPRAGASPADYHALSRTMTFPCEYRFKAVGDGADFLRSVLADIQAVTGVPVPPEAVVEEPSDRYRRLNIGVAVQSAVQIGAVFEAIRANRHVRFCFSS